MGNHGLVDGNKRLGWLSVVVFYGLNGEELDVPADAAYHLVIDVASGRVSMEQIATQLRPWR